MRCLANLPRLFSSRVRWYVGVDPPPAGGSPLTHILFPHHNMMHLRVSSCLSWAGPRDSPAWTGGSEFSMIIAGDLRTQIEAALAVTASVGRVSTAVWGRKGGARCYGGRCGGCAHAVQMLADEPLVATLTIDDATVRVEVARALGDLADAWAIEPLAAALTDLDDEVQWRLRKRWRVFAMGAP
jgi:hypothetical protein